MFDGPGQQVPPLLTGGETSTNVLVDWVSASFPKAALPPIGDFLKEVRRLFDGTVTEFRDRHGINGYDYSCISDQGGVIVAWGGNGDTVFLNIPGEACARVWCFHTLRDFIEQHSGHLTRCDLAFDDFRGIHDLALVLSLYAAGAFKGTAGGRQPSLRQIGNWVAEDGTGRSVYVGKRKNGKELCVYEKGKQLGDEASTWVRWEVRLANVDRALPLAMLVDPAGFARGAYPALSFIEGESVRIATRKAQERITVAKLTHHAREAYGPLVDVLARSGATAVQIIDKVRRDGVPRRLGAPTDAELMERAHRLIDEIIGEEIDERSEVWG